MFNPISKIKNLYQSAFNTEDLAGKTLAFAGQFEGEINHIKIQLGNLKTDLIRSKGLLQNIQEAEFKAFSQFGDDGIIQYLIHQIDIAHKTFIEFGVENYKESNTRFLLLNNNWKGLIIDGSEKNMQEVKGDEIYWRHDLTAISAFITTQNINQIFKENGFEEEIGILSIDIDGNDYWVWESINSVNPVIVIVEYNSVFGDKFPITIPYKPDFNRTEAHYSNLFWGASMAAFNQLAEKKGYWLIGSNSAGNNAYFVRKDKIANLKPLSVKDAYIESKFRESRDKNYHLSYISGKERLKAIEDCSVWDILQEKEIKIRDLIG